MDMAGALRARLLAAPAVTALVGQRVYWVDRPQTTGLPAITLQLVSEGRPQHMGGFDGLFDARVQVDIWSESHAEAWVISEAVIAAIIPEQTGNGISFSRAFLDARRDLGERIETKFVHRTSLDLLIHYSTV
jgi:hypothetical protein